MSDLIDIDDDAVERTIQEQADEIERLTAELLKRDAIWLPAKDAEIAKLEGIESATLPFFTWMFNQGYQQGHHDTVEGMFTDVLPEDSSEYHDDIVKDLLGEYALQGNDADGR